MIFLSPTQSFVYQKSWMHPRSKHWHLIDYVIARKTERQSDRDYVWCRLLDRSSTDCQQTQPKNPACEATSRQERLDGSKLNLDSMRQAFLTDICNQLDGCNQSQFREPRRKLDSFPQKSLFFSCYSTVQGDFHQPAHPRGEGAARKRIKILISTAETP